MKKTLLGLMWLGTTAALAALNQEPKPNPKPAPEPVPAPTKYQAVENGLNHRIWERNVFERAPDGRLVTRKHQYTELATGLNYRDDQGNLLPSEEVIEEYTIGAIARHGQYQVIFANNLNTYGSIDMQTPDGKRLRSNILGLAYYDRVTGQTVIIAQIQDTTGQLIADNQALYTNAFSGVNADVRYTYKKGSFEQDVILRAQPPTPESYGLNPENSELIVMTEFLNPPEARVDSAKVGDATDQNVSWGATELGHGKAFDLEEPRGPRSSLKVTRQYETVNGRQMLFERVPVKQLNAKLEKLPMHASINKSKSSLRMAANEWNLPATPKAQAVRRPMKLASAQSSSKGFVLDYIVINTGETNYTFKGDMTYHISDTCNFAGTTTLESGAVLKYSWNGQINILSTGSIDCKTGPYRPAVFTSTNDNSLGETISGSSGAPTSGDAYVCLSLDPASAYLHDLRFSYCYAGVNCGTCYFVDVSDCQFIGVDSAVWGSVVALHNVLITCANSISVDGAVYLIGNTLTAENVTADGGQALADFDNGGAVTLAATNCLVTGQPLAIYGESIAYHTNATVCLTSPSVPVYQTVGGGSYYLTNNSPYRQIGTIQVSPALLDNLANKTTYPPPVVWSGVSITNVTVFGPLVSRDNNTTNLDLGYHYDALDYAFDAVVAYTNVTFTAGTAVAWFQPYGYSDGNGLGLMNNVTATFAGTATDPCHAVLYSRVQEDGNAVWIENSHAGIDPVESYVPAEHPTIDANFTIFSTSAWSLQNFGDGSGVNLMTARMRNCEIYGTFSGYNMQTWFTNCLLFCVDYWQGTTESQYGFESYRDFFDNCTFHGGVLEFAHWESPPDWLVSIQNCAFDGVALNLYDASDGFGWLTSDYNATNATCTYGGHDLPGSHNVHPLGNYNWQSGWFGSFYLPAGSTLINAGDATADNFALYHFTTQTNQLKETNSTVDIGYHYVATDAYGNPLDTDGDNIADYLEDTNGNGIFDGGDYGDWLVSLYNGLSRTYGLQVFTPLK